MLGSQAAVPDRFFPVKLIRSLDPHHPDPELRWIAQGDEDPRFLAYFRIWGGSLGCLKGRSIIFALQFVSCPLNGEFGGLSGGPLLSCFVSKNSFNFPYSRVIQIFIVGNLGELTIKGE
ncbi:MAG: hypothetical protein ACE5OZ_08975 [Candidatus Heimdallarchaeota archaeon]